MTRTVSPIAISLDGDSPVSLQESSRKSGTWLVRCVVRCALQTLWRCWNGRTELPTLDRQTDGLGASSISLIVACRVIEIAGLFHLVRLPRDPVKRRPTVIFVDTRDPSCPFKLAALLSDKSEELALLSVSCM